MSNHPASPSLINQLLTQATKLGIVIFVLFGLGAGLTYGLLELLGWEGDSQIIIALFVGPLLGIALVGIIGLMFKPYIQAALKTTSQESSSSTKN
jgi:phosphate/sulfate permease